MAQPWAHCWRSVKRKMICCRCSRALWGCVCGAIWHMTCIRLAVIMQNCSRLIFRSQEKKLLETLHVSYCKASMASLLISLFHELTRKGVHHQTYHKILSLHATIIVHICVKKSLPTVWKEHILLNASSQRLFLKTIITAITQPLLSQCLKPSCITKTGAMSFYLKVSENAKQDLKDGLALYNSENNIGLRNAWNIIQAEVGTTWQILH